MKVSIALHVGEPDPRSNQRDLEATYQNYNRRYADLEIDQSTGNGLCDFAEVFPIAGELFIANFFSIGICVAPTDLGGSIIIFGPIPGGLRGNIGNFPSLEAACFVENARLVELGLVVRDGVFW